MGEKEEAFPLYRGNEALHLPTCLMKPARSPSPRLVVQLGYPHPIDENPAIRGARPLPRQDVPRKPPRNMRSSWL